jgi:hypothetical protein
VTSVERLDSARRVEEIARMIGGAAVTAPVRASARELLAAGARGESESRPKGESESPKRGRG